MESLGAVEVAGRAHVAISSQLSDGELDAHNDALTDIINETNNDTNNVRERDSSG